VLEVLAQSNGVVSKILKTEGETVLSSEVIGEFSESEGKPETLKKNNETIVDLKEDKNEETEVERDIKKISPAAKKIIIENNIETENVKSSGKNNRITKADVINHISPDIEESSVLSEFSEDDRPQKRVPMSRLRSTIAKRLVSVKQDTAMLTTFNEVDMLPIKDLRSKYGEEFEKEHGVKLGFMGFFVVAAVQALKKFPMVNASIDKNDIVYHGFQDIGVAVSTERGLVVPIIKDADTKSLSEIEKSILEYSKKAKEGKLSIDEMQGGTFTISNGGVFGSLLSTPILNAPQTAILGMHAIQERPIAIAGEIVIRPMMYLAMSYDHRLLDGKEAVTFLVSIKEQLESPERLLLNL
jgi:2-oxoglutarate dehydrogenase E2 component (dihydrolipoamide succinyltransferase)